MAIIEPESLKLDLPPSFTEKCLIALDDAFSQVYLPASTTEFAELSGDEIQPYYRPVSKKRNIVLRFFGLIAENEECPNTFSQYIYFYLLNLPLKNDWWLKKLLKIVFIIPGVIIRILRIPFTTLLNLAKLFTELLPLFAIHWADINLIYLSRLKHFGPIEFIKKMGFYLLELIGFEILFTARAITSPLYNAVELFTLGRKIHIVLGCSLALISLSVTVLAYILFFPLALKSIALALPTVTTQVSAGLVTHVPWVSHIGKFLTVAGHAVTTSVTLQGFYGIMVGFVEGALGAGTVLGAASLFLMGLGYASTAVLRCWLKRQFICDVVNFKTDMTHSSKNTSDALEKVTAPSVDNAPLPDEADEIPLPPDRSFLTSFSAILENLGWHVTPYMPGEVIISDVTIPSKSLANSIIPASSPSRIPCPRQ